MLWILAWLLALVPASGQESLRNSALYRQIALAEASLDDGETEMAESHFRGALLEGWLLMGALDAAEGNWEQAKQAYQRARVSAVETRRAETSLAMLHLKLGEGDEAVGILRVLVAKESGSGNIRRLLAQALVLIGHLSEAVQELEELHHEKPEDLETTFALASGYLKKGDLERADLLLGEIAEARPIPQTHLLIGRTYRDFREFDRAREALQRAIELDPEIRRGHYYLGTVEVMDRGMDAIVDAIGHFEKEIELFPEDPMTNLYLGKALAEERRFEEAIPRLEISKDFPLSRLDSLRFLGKCYLGLRVNEKAVEVLDTALKEATEKNATPRQLSESHYQLGLALRRVGRAEEAKVHFDAAQASSTDVVEEQRVELAEKMAGDERLDVALGLPLEVGQLGKLSVQERAEIESEVRRSLTQVYSNLGTMRARDGRFEAAVSLFESASELMPDYPRVAYSLGASAFNAGNFPVAADALTRAVEEDPSNADLRRMLALAHVNLEQYPPAVALLRDDPQRSSNPSLQFAFGMSLVRSGQVEEGSRVFDQLIAKNANWPELHVLLGQAHAQNEDFDAAIESFRRALSIRPDVPEANSSLGFIYLRKGMLEEAEVALRRELEHRPEDAQARYQLAVVLDQNRESEAAVTELRTVLRVRPEFADARYLMGKIQLASGNPEDAAAHLEAAVEMAPEDYNIRYQLGLAYQRLGRREESKVQFAAYRELKGAPGALR